MVHSVIVVALLTGIKAISRLFFTFDMRWMEKDLPSDPWQNVRLVVFLNHTSLFEPIFVGGVQSSFIRRIARHGVVPVAEKTMRRPVAGRLFRLVAKNVVTITRERDQTWSAVLQKVGRDSMVVILPEGRMMRSNGLDAEGNPLTVRGGVADIIGDLHEGTMVIAYSGGLHHVQIPGQRLPRLFRTVRMNFERVDIAEYKHKMMMRGGVDGFKREVRSDLEDRRDRNCPVDTTSVSAWPREIREMRDAR